jgi:hypothetical protein
MNQSDKIDRRVLLRRMALGLSLTPLMLTKSSITRAAPLPLLSEQDPAAKAVHYVEDASRAKDAPSGARCSNCSIYSATGETAGTCTLFKNKWVKAAGWCTAWSGL